MENEKPFKLVSKYRPTGDQPEAIDQLVKGLENGVKEQVLMGVTGSGKTFTMANVIEQMNRPTLVLAPIMTIINRKLTFPQPIPISKRIPPSTMKSISCATPPPLHCPSGGM